MSREHLLTENDATRKDQVLKLFDSYGTTVYGFVLRAVSSPALASKITVAVFSSFGKMQAPVSLSELIATARQFVIPELCDGNNERWKEAQTFDFNTFQKESSPEGARLQQKLKETRSVLEPKCKTILEMAFFSGFSQREIETALNLPDGGTAMRLRRALNDLRRKFSLN